MTLQALPWKHAKLLTKYINTPQNISDLKQLRELLYNHLIFLDRDTKKQKQEEISIRWKRTGEQILKDKYVYKWKACTDIVIAYITLLRALKIPCHFIKLKTDRTIHSVVEIELWEQSYIADISSSNPIYKIGRFAQWKCWNNWIFWKKWQDSWDIWLTKYADTKK